MDPKIVAELVELKEAVDNAQLQRVWQAEVQKAAQVSYEQRSIQLMAAAPQFFRDFAAHWEGMTAFDDGPRRGCWIGDFSFAIFRDQQRVMYEVAGQVSDRRALDPKDWDLETTLPRLVLDCLHTHYRKANLVTDGEG